MYAYYTGEKLESAIETYRKILCHTLDKIKTIEQRRAYYQAEFREAVKIWWQGRCWTQNEIIALGLEIKAKYLL